MEIEKKYLFGFGFLNYTLMIRYVLLDKVSEAVGANSVTTLLELNRAL